MKLKYQTMDRELQEIGFESNGKRTAELMNVINEFKKEFISLYSKEELVNDRLSATDAEFK